MDLLMTDQSASQASDKIKDILFNKSAEKINAIKPNVANSLFDTDVDLDSPEETEAELDQDVDLDQEGETPEASAEEEEPADPQSAVAAGAVSMGRAV